MTLTIRVLIIHAAAADLRLMPIIFLDFRHATPPMPPCRHATLLPPSITPLLPLMLFLRRYNDTLPAHAYYAAASPPDITFDYATITPLLMRAARECRYAMNIFCASSACLFEQYAMIKARR